MASARITAQRRERIERLTDRQRNAFVITPYWQDATGPGYDPDMAREDAIAERDAWDEDMPCDAYDPEPF